MAKTIKTELRAVVAKAAPAVPYLFNIEAPRYADADLEAKWRAAVAWLRRGRKSRWIMDNVAPPRWRDIFDDAGNAFAESQPTARVMR